MAEITSWTGCISPCKTFNGNRHHAVESISNINESAAALVSFS